MSDASASPEMSLEIVGSYRGVGGGDGVGTFRSCTPTVSKSELLISSCATVVSADTGTSPPTSEGVISRMISAEGRSVRVVWLYTATLSAGAS